MTETMLCYHLSSQTEHCQSEAEHPVHALYTSIFVYVFCIYTLDHTAMYRFWTCVLLKAVNKVLRQLHSAITHTRTVPYAR